MIHLLELIAKIDIFVKYVAMSLIILRMWSYRDVYVCWGIDVSMGDILD